MKEIQGKMAGGGFSHEDAMQSVCCFDPKMVLVHLKEEFGEAFLIDLTDYAWKDWKMFLRMNDVESAMKVAESDALRRGPIYKFVISENGVKVKGHVERYYIVLRSDKTIPNYWTYHRDHRRE